MWQTELNLEIQLTIKNSEKSNQNIGTIGDIACNFSILKKSQGKLECLIYEMLWKKPCVYAQSGSIRT